MDKPYTGRCYCGHIQFFAKAEPKSVSYCHCADCRRVCGSPVAVFAGFEEGAIEFTPDEGKAIEVNEGVRRSFCPDCGTPLTGRYDYIAGMNFVPLGLFDQIDKLAPQFHSHVNEQAKWLHIDDNLERLENSSRDLFGGKI